MKELLYKYIREILDSISAKSLEELYDYWSTNNDLLDRFLKATDYMKYDDPTLRRFVFQEFLSLWSYERTGSDFVHTRDDTLVRRKYYRAFPWETYPEHPKAKKLRHDYPSDLVQIQSINEITVY